jgi:hypothetical protein
MTKERAKYISEKFAENWDTAKEIGAENINLRLAASIVMTIDDILEEKERLVKAETIMESLSHRD